MTKVLGERASAPIKAADLDVVEVDNLAHPVRYTTKELNALCPVTGQPDQYEVIIQYDAPGRTIESKSLKLYLWSFRDKGIFAEDLASVIAKDLCKVLRFPVRVHLTQQVRGGLVLEVDALGEPVYGSDDV
jgi:7-cyano-7-deazaguanine reductase